MPNKLWVIRPVPNFTNRLGEFLDNGMVAIGWPAVGNLGGGLNREQIEEKLESTYVHYQGELKTELAVAAGILHRFVNVIKPGDYVVVPSQNDIYLAEVTGDYCYHEELCQEGTEGGYPHWRAVHYLKGPEPYCRLGDLPLGVRRGLECLLTVFSVHSSAKAMWKFLGVAEEQLDEFF